MFSVLKAQKTLKVSMFMKCRACYYEWQWVTVLLKERYEMRNGYTLPIIGAHSVTKRERERERESERDFPTFTLYLKKHVF